MISSLPVSNPKATALAGANATATRRDDLDAVRAFALVLGVVFHASLSFMPMFIGWAVQDVSTNPWVAAFMIVSHSFRMETFFLIAGFFSHLAYHRNGVRAFARSRFLRIVVPFVVGWFLLRPLLVSGWILGAASLRGNVDVGAALIAGFKSLEALPAGIFTGSHLWFLYYLAMITGLSLIVRTALAKTPSWFGACRQLADRCTTRLADSPWAVVWLAVPIATLLHFMNLWGVDTPDQSLRPHVPVLLLYGGFFTLGWQLERQRENIVPLARLSPSRWIPAVIGIPTVLLLAGIERDPGHPYYAAARLGYALAYAITMVSLVLLTLGTAGRLCQRPNGIIRYVADSAYWMYLVHLPIVIGLQVAVAELPLHWSLKLGFVSAATIALSLLTYDFFVRSTIIGWILNGCRRERVLTRWMGRLGKTER